MENQKDLITITSAEEEVHYFAVAMKRLDDGSARAQIVTEASGEMMMNMITSFCESFINDGEEHGFPKAMMASILMSAVDAGIENSLGVTPISDAVDEAMKGKSGLFRDLFYNLKAKREGHE